MIVHFLHFFFAQPGQPWYQAAVWGNVVAIAPCGIIAFLWGRAVERRHLLHLKHGNMLLEELHHLAHTGEPHPRVTARLAAGEAHTSVGPNLP
jgi:hypothetical protein